MCLEVIRPKNPTVKIHLDLTTNTDFDEVIDKTYDLMEELGVSVDSISFEKME